MRSNILLATSSISFAPGGTSGVSYMALSYGLRSDEGFLPLHGVLQVCLALSAPTAPVWVELRSTWPNALGVSQTTAQMVGRVSNTATFGLSAPQVQVQTLLLSGQQVMLPFEHVVGTTVQCWLIAASTTAVAVTGDVAFWLS